MAINSPQIQILKLKAKKPLPAKAILEKFKKRDFLVGFGFYMLSFLIHFLLWLELKNSPLFHTPEMDMLWHWQWAGEVAQGDFWGKGVFFRAPLYPYFLALLVLIAGRDLIRVRLVQALFGSLASPFVYLICRKLNLKINSCIVAGILTAFYPLLIFFDLEFLIPVLIIPLDLLLILILLKLGSSKKIFWGALAGLILGLSAIARPNILIIIPLILFWSIRRFKEKRAKWLFKLWCWMVVGISIAIMPVFLRNLIIGGEPVLICTQGGINFWIGNNSLSDGKTSLAPGPQRGYGKYIDNVWLNSKLVAEKALGKKLKEAQVSRFWWRKGLRYWKEEPFGALGLFLKKWYFLINGEEIASNQDYYYFRKEGFLLRVLLWKFGIKFPFGLLLPFAFAGLFWLGKRLKENPDLWLIVGFVLFYGLSVVMFFVNARFRLPLIPFLIILAVAGGEELFKLIRVREIKRVILGAFVFALFLFISNSNYFAVNNYDRFRNWVREGNYYFEQGDLKRAFQSYRKALELNPKSVEAYAGLGNIALKRAKPTIALRFYLKALEIEPENAQLHYNIGICYELLQDKERARKSFEQALQIWPDYKKAKEHLKWLNQSQ